MADIMSEQKKYQLWGGRFSGKLDERVARFSRSLEWEWRLLPYDLAVNRAHGRMLLGIGVFTESEWSGIEAAIDQLVLLWNKGELQPDPEIEDVHTYVEAELFARAGEAAKRIHTGRSRNDQVVTDVRLYVRDAVDEIIKRLTDIRQALLETAEREIEIIIPGYTHLQRAQPVRLAHHLLAYVEMFGRDRERLHDAQKRINLSPLGCTALAGSSFPLDREAVAEELGFEGLLENSMDGVGDRDFILEPMSAFAVIGTHISRLAEEYVLWPSQEFGFVSLPESYCTGSSALPHKKNPDLAELLRGKTARLTGNLVTLFTLLKGLPLTYNRDLQEDKQPLFDSVDTLLASLELIPDMITGSTYFAEKMRSAAESGHWQAMNIAEMLTKSGVPFREAHKRVGGLVQEAEKASCSIPELGNEKLTELLPELKVSDWDSMTLESVVDSITSHGGTGKTQVMASLKRLKKELLAEYRG